MDARTAAGIVRGVDHYENFPVASILVPARVRPAIVAIYRFARHADDVADEGDAPAPARLAELDRMRDALLGVPGAGHPTVDALRPVLQAHALPVDDCLALLSAFRQDVTVTRYADDAALRDYCHRSADPVGRLVLRLFGCLDAGTEPLSDAICSALQLVNFVQDVAIDWRRGRLYLPLDALAVAGAGPDTLAQAARDGRAPRALRACIEARARHAAALLESGAPLVRRVPRRLGWQLRATLAGARRILERLAHDGFDPFAARPTIRWRDAPALVRLTFHPPKSP